MTPARGIPLPDLPGGWLLHAETRTLDVIAEVHIPGEPQSKARARKGADGRFYTPRTTSDAQTDIETRTRHALPRGWKADPDWTWGVRAIFRTTDDRHRDSDNMVKLVLDALNHVVWHDDWQVVETPVRVDRGVDVPGTWLRLYRVGLLPPRPTVPARKPRKAPAASVEAVRARLRARAPGRRILPD